MRRYYTASSQDPESDDYDPKVVTPRPLYSENEEILLLRSEVFILTKQLAEYKARDPIRKKEQHEEISAIGSKKEARTIDEGISGLKFTTVEATPKAPSGGITSAKAAPKPKAKASQKKS